MYIYSYIKYSISKRLYSSSPAEGIQYTNITSLSPIVPGAPSRAEKNDTNVAAPLRSYIKYYVAKLGSS